VAMLDKLSRKPRWLRRLSPGNRKLVTGLIGLVLILGGAALMPVPGPFSIPVILAGLTILSWEYVWARKGRAWVGAKVRTVKKWRAARRAEKAGCQTERRHVA
jgi:putative transmembrane protein PGPGW